MRLQLGIITLMAVVVLAAWPAWTGSWVYDDVLMAENPAMDDLGDLLATPSRSSAAYFPPTPVADATGSTYRPLSIATLVAVNALVGKLPWVHHLISLLMHLACVLLLHRTVQRHTSSVAALWLTCVFALHPLGIEAWGWINGRSDVLVALGTAVLVWALDRPKPALWAVALGSSMCVFSKESGSVVSVGLLACFALPPRGFQANLRRLLGSAGVTLAMVLGASVARTSVVPPHHGGLIALLDLERDLASTWVEMLGQSVASLLPVPRTMDNLAELLAGGLTFRGAALAALALGLLVWALVAGRARSAALLGLAGALILPSVFVRHTLWLGFDRYLYVPLYLVMLSAAFATSGEFLTQRSAIVRRTLLAGSALLLAACTFKTATYYRDQSEFLASQMEMHPAVGALMGTRWLDAASMHDQAASLAAQIPRTGLPPGLARDAVILLSDLHREAEAARVFEDMLSRHRDDPYVRFDAVGVRLAQGRLSEALELAKSLRDAGPLCAALPTLWAEEARRNPSSEAFSAANEARAKAVLEDLGCAR